MIAEAVGVEVGVKALDLGVNVLVSVVDISVEVMIITDMLPLNRVIESFGVAGKLLAPPELKLGVIVRVADPFDQLPVDRLRTVVLLDCIPINRPGALFQTVVTLLLSMPLGAVVLLSLGCSVFCMALVWWFLGL